MAKPAGLYAPSGSFSSPRRSNAGIAAIPKLALVIAGLSLAGQPGCSDSATPDSAAGSDAGPSPADARAAPELGGSAACPFSEESPGLLEAPHVASLEGVTYTSNPPSSGPHCPSWGYWSFYRPPLHLPRCNYIHNLEHGGVVILFRDRNLDPGTLGWLEALLPRLTGDPDCPSPRVIITADPDLDTPLAAVTWGFTFKASCPDSATADALVDFAGRHWGRNGLAPEPLVCADGGARGAELPP